MLRRDTPNSDRTELSEMLRRLSRTGGTVTVSLDGEPIARVDATTPPAMPPQTSAPAPADRTGERHAPDRD